MFRKKKVENNVNGYILFISKVVKDEKTKKEIIDQLNYFSSNGIINIDGSNLTGKIIDKNGNLYLDIKYGNDKFMCSYTKWNLNSVILIEQEGLKSGNYKITKTDKTKYDSNNYQNEYSIEIEEKIYNKTGQILYESERKISEEFNSYKDGLVYKDDSPFKNVIDVEKTWYIKNGSIIKYKMKKNELDSKGGIKESYLICSKPLKTERETILNFSEIPKELYISFMIGELTIEEVLEKLNEKDVVKKKKGKQ